MVHLIRRINLKSPFSRFKPPLARLVQHRLPRDAGYRPYTGIDAGMGFNLDLARRPHRMIYLNAYQAPITDLIKRILRPGDTYIDIGASIGYFVGVVAMRVGYTGRVFAFEPQPYHCDILRGNLALNDFPQVTLRQTACWSSPGQATLHHFAGSKPTTSSLAHRPDKEIADTITVPTVRIDDEVAPPVRLIKIDVEGAEREVLRGAQRAVSTSPRPHLIVELNPKTTVAFGYNPIEVVDRLLGFGPNRLRLLRSRRTVPTTRDELKRGFDENPMKTFNVHFEPLGG